MHVAMQICNPPQAAQAQLWISDARDVLEGFVAFFDLFG